jgi:hypothetical protein
VVFRRSATLLAPPRIVDAKPLPEYGNFFGNAALAKRRERGWFTDKGPRAATAIAGLFYCDAMKLSSGDSVRCSGGFLPPSPSAEKATAREDQARKASTGDGTGHRLVVDIRLNGQL